MKILSIGQDKDITGNRCMVWQHPDGDSSAYTPKDSSYRALEFKDANGKLVAPVCYELETVGIDGTTSITLAPQAARIEIVDSAETTKDGALRVLLKVSIPYFGIDTGLITDGTVGISQGRSKHMLTAHTVVTLPREWVEDVKGAKAGASGRKLAERQLAVAMGLLQQLLGSPTRQSQAVSGLKAANTADQTKVLPETGVDENPVLSYADDAHTTSLSLKGVITTPGYDLRTENIPGTDSKQVIVSANAEVILAGDNQNAFWRAVNKLTPLDRDGTYGQKAFGTIKWS